MLERAELHDNTIDKTDYRELTIFPILQAEIIAYESFRYKQKGRLIAKLIAITRYPHLNHDLHSERSSTLRKLANYGNPLTRFIARLDENPFADQRTLVRVCFGEEIVN